MQLKKFPGIKESVYLKPFSMMGVGGCASYFYSANKRADLVAVVRLAKKAGVKYRILGKGSNVLFADDGYDGLIIENKTRSLKIEGDLITVDSGFVLMELVRISAEYGLVGLERLAGLPGVIGSAVYGNAGSFGVEIGEFIVSVDCLNADGEEKTILKKDLQFGYRDSSFKQMNDVVILGVTMQFEVDNNTQLTNDVRHYLNLRASKQPAVRSCGSYFKNPGENSMAGKLIDVAGLKGSTVGGAKVSEKHANFLINTGDATCEDFLLLAERIKEVVFEKYGIMLEEEVCFVGNENREDYIKKIKEEKTTLSSN